MSNRLYHQISRLQGFSVWFSTHNGTRPSVTASGASSPTSQFLQRAANISVATGASTVIATASHEPVPRRRGSTTCRRETSGRQHHPRSAAPTHPRPEVSPLDAARPRRSRPNHHGGPQTTRNALLQRFLIIRNDS